MYHFRDPLDLITPKTDEENEALKKINKLKGQLSYEAGELAEFTRILAHAIEESVLDLHGDDERRRQLITYVSNRNEELTSKYAELNEARANLAALICKRNLREE